jgi:hypothetical protein
MAKEVERCLALEPNAPTLPAATMTLSADQPQFFTMGEITERLDHGARGGDRGAGWITTTRGAVGVGGPFDCHGNGVSNQSGLGSQTVDRVGQQDIPGRPSKDARPRADIEHSVDDNGSPAVKRAALRSDAVDRLIVALRINFPHDPAVFGRVSAQPSINRASSSEIPTKN